MKPVDRVTMILSFSALKNTLSLSLTHRCSEIFIMHWASVSCLNFYSIQFLLSLFPIVSLNAALSSAFTSFPSRTVMRQKHFYSTFYSICPLGMHQSLLLSLVRAVGSRGAKRTKALPVKRASVDKPNTFLPVKLHVVGGCMNLACKYVQ